ncbi:MAG: amidophosphoribosyltransferase, partial [Actinobacteria bacterium]|nr:amidophosphoribosyltransferase [Actinomycetota bacterium]
MGNETPRQDPDRKRPDAHRPENHGADDYAGPREECGVFGVWAPGEEVAKLAYFGLYAQQHRGQEAAG